MAELYTPEEILRIFEDYNRARANNEPITDELAKQFKDASVGVKNYTNNLNYSLEKLGKSALQFGKDLNSGAQGAKAFNNVLSQSSDTVDKWGKKFGQLGTLISGIYDSATAMARATAEQADTLYETNQQLSRTGTLGAGGMTEVYATMQKFGTNVNNIEEMAELLTQNSTVFAQMGKGAYDGVQSVANLSDSIMASPLKGELMNMGLSVKDINKGIAGYIRQQTAMGATQLLSADQLREGAKAYLYEMEELSRVTGLTQQQMADQRTRAQQTDVFMATVASMDKNKPGSGERLYNAYNRLMSIDPSGHLAAGMASSVTGLASDDKDAQMLWQLTQGQSVEWGNQLKAGTLTEAEYVDRITKAVAKNEDTYLRMAEMGTNVADTYGKMEMITSIAGQAKKDAIKTDKDAVAKTAAAAKGADLATRTQTNLRLAQLDATKGMNNMLNNGIYPLLTGLRGVMTMLSWIPGMPKRSEIEEAGAATAGAAGAPGAVSGAATTAPAGANPISKIIGTGPGWLEVMRPDGKSERLMGARNWRNNNPGNIEYGAFAKNHGAIGSDGRFAIFPDYDTGRKAKAALLFDGSRYKDLSLTSAIARYAPPTENNTASYQRAVLAAVGNQDRAMASYNEGERNAIMDAMQKVEGYKVGTVSPIGYKTGGIASGPTSGYETTLHGTEAVVPLPDGKTIPVEISDSTEALYEQATMILGQDVARMSTMLLAMEKRLSVAKKTAQRMSH